MSGLMIWSLLLSKVYSRPYLKDPGPLVLPRRSSRLGVAAAAPLQAGLLTLIRLSFEWWVTGMLTVSWGPGA